jgi:hypothetical protein
VEVKGTGGHERDKNTMINSWTYDRFREARANKQHVTTRTLQQWGMAASFQFTSPAFPSKASAGWVQYFKRKHNIRHRHTTKYISSKDDATF